MWLALLNLGPTELALVLVLFLALFGADKLPQLARGLGRARSEFDAARRQAETALKTEEERLLEEQLAFERLREHQVAQQVADPERAALARAAQELGLQAEGRTAEELRADIARRVAEAGAQKDAENAARAQQ